MRITKSYLKQIIKEELQNVSLEEQEQLEEISLKGILAGAALIGALVAAGMSGESAKESLQKLERDPSVETMLKKPVNQLSAQEMQLLTDLAAMERKATGSQFGTHQARRDSAVQSMKK